MESILKLRGVLNVAFLLLLINNLSFASDLLEPTRTLSGTGASVGKLSVFSEPLGLEVTLDGKKIGKTPVFSQKVAPGVHVLLVKNAETEIYVAPAQNLGYMIAEMRGRKNEALESTLGWTFFIAAGSAIFIEVIKTYPAINNISVLSILIIISASLYGAVLYRLQLSAIERLNF